MAAEKTVVYTSSSMTGTNADKKAGGTCTISFYRSSGDQPMSGCTLIGATVYISQIKTYTGKNPGFDIGPYGSIGLSYDEGIHSENNTLYGAPQSLLNFTGGSITFMVTGGSGNNVLNLRSGGYITITVHYSITSASTGSLSSSSVNQGSNITMNIMPADDSFYHFVQWYRSSSQTYTQILNPGVTSTTYQIPSGWSIGQAWAHLTTTADAAGKQVIGTVSYPYTINVDPTSIVPTAGTLTAALSQSPYVPADWGAFVKGYSKALLSLSGCSPGSGASYRSIALSCGSQSQSAASETSYTTGVINETGLIDCNATVTNSYGNNAAATKKTITVYDYASPYFTNLTAFRCLQNGTANDNGTYISVLAGAAFYSVTNKNSLVALQVQYKLSTASTWSTAVAITNGAIAIIGGDAITGTGKYQVRAVAIDQIQNLQGSYSEKISTVMTSNHVMFLKDGGLNASFGKEGERDNAFEISENWKIFHGDTRLDGTVPISRGGTGQITAAAALFALINGISAITPVSADRFPLLDVSGNTTGYVTLANFLTALGFSSGILPIAMGGTAASNAATARSNLGITPGNIGAASSAHQHAASAITSGTIAIDRLPFRIDCGIVYINGVSWSNVGFSTAFTSTPVIVVSYAGNASSSGINPLKTSGESPYGFQVCMSGSSGSGSRQVNWIAIQKQ